MGDPTTTALAAELRALRERRSQTQIQVAARSGIAQGMISAYERGERRPGMGPLSKLLDALDATDADRLAIARLLTVEILPPEKGDDVAAIGL